MSVLKIGLLLGSLLYFGPLHSQDTIVSTYPNTQQKWEKVYQNGQKVAENIYHSNESPWMTVQYDPKSKEYWKWYYEDGTPYFEATIIKDRLQGIYRIWYENGQLAEEITFKDHLENGAASFYHSNGQLAMKGQYLQGQMTGQWQFFDQNGNTPTGRWQWKFAADSKNIRMKGQFQNGQPTGQWEYWTTANQGQANHKKFTRQYR